MQVLVVCTANIARSPLAAALLQHGLGDDAAVSSAGVRAREGDPAAPESVALAARHGLDLTAHRSRPLTDALVEDAELILTMSEQQRDHCARLRPRAAMRAFTLRELHRLLRGVDFTDAPQDGADRLRWLRAQAQRARPLSEPAREREDVPDPIGRPLAAWQRLDTELRLLLSPLLGAPWRPHVE